jgi:hypothetical protein
MTTKPITRLRSGVRTQLPRAVVILCCTSLVACTTLSPIPVRPQNEAGSADVGVAKPGDKLVVKLKAGEVVEMTLVSVQAQEITGSLTAQGKQVTIQTSQIASLERREVSMGRTAIFLGAALTVLVLIGFGFLGARLAGG